MVFGIFHFRSFARDGFHEIPTFFRTKIEYKCLLSIGFACTNESTVNCLFTFHLEVNLARVTFSRPLISEFKAPIRPIMTTAQCNEPNLNEENALVRDEQGQRNPSTNSSTPSSSRGDKQFQFTQSTSER